MFPIMENNWDIKYIQIFPDAIGEGLHHNVFITEKLAHYKTSHTLKCDVFKIPDNKNIEKFFSKYEVIFLDQASSGSNLS